jgi:hypothetical protein
MIFKPILSKVAVYLAVLVFVVPLIVLILFANATRRQNENIATPTTSTSAQANVPFPTKEDVVRTFCALIDEGRIADAVSMMDIKDDTTRQAWGVSLNNFSSFKLTNINKSTIDNSENSYEVDINVTLKKNITDLPIPNYGWTNGLNKRWIGVTESRPRNYKITGIATGP